MSRQDPPETTIQARAGELSFVIQIPNRPDGAMPYLLEHAVDQCIRGFRECFDDYELDPDDEDEATTAPGDDATAG